MRKKFLLTAALFGSVVLTPPTLGQTFVEEEGICEEYNLTNQSLANLFLTLDYSGSMWAYTYQDEEYDPNKVYLGFFDPLRVYAEIEKDGIIYYVPAEFKDEELKFIWNPRNPFRARVALRNLGEEQLNRLRNRFRNCWRHGHYAEDGVDYYSGNYLNWLYMKRYLMEQAVLTGGKVVK
ncbi:MAG: hypothetical protein GXO08_01555, partial [Aquificae bacterium]|nr:hypothetical protein [Aquificota bacterium]